MNRPDDRDAACLARTRSVVLNLFLAAGASIAASGFWLRRLDRGSTLWPPTRVGRYAHVALLVLVVLSVLIRRLGLARSIRLEPGARRRWFAASQVASASIGLLAAPLGVAYGFAVSPRVHAVAPFWIAAMALGFLAIPRGEELGGPEPSDGVES